MLLKNEKNINKFELYLILAAFLILASKDVFSAWAQVRLSSSDVSGMTVHTTYHTVTTARNYAAISTIADLPLGCSSLFIDTEANRSSYALLTSALVSGKDFNLGIDSSIVSPWDPSICAINYVTIKP